MAKRQSISAKQEAAYAASYAAFQAKNRAGRAAMFQAGRPAYWNAIAKEQAQLRKTGPAIQAKINARIKAEAKVEARAAKKAAPAKKSKAVTSTAGKASKGSAPKKKAAKKAKPRGFSVKSTNLKGVLKPVRGAKGSGAKSG